MIEPFLPDLAIFAGCRHRLVAFALKCIAHGDIAKFTTIPMAVDMVTPVRELSVRENIAQLNSKSAKPTEIWGTVKTLTAALFRKFSVKSFSDKVESTGRPIGRDAFGEFMELKSGTRQKFHHAAKCLEEGVKDETIVSGLRLDHKDWGAVWKAVEGAVSGKADKVAKIAIDGLLEDKDNKDKPLTVANLKVLESKAAEMPEVQRLLVAIRTGEFASAKTAVNQLAEVLVEEEEETEENS